MHGRDKIDWPERWVNVNRHTRCPICGRSGWCSIGTNGVWAKCRREAKGCFRSGLDKGGEMAYYHRLDGEPVTVAYQPPPKPKATQAEVQSLYEKTWNRITQDQRQWLAEDLSVSVSSITQLGVGYGSDHNGKEWFAFPERNPAGEIVGVNRRYRDGQKKLCYRHSRGLSFAPPVNSTAGVVLCVEGGSDVLAGLTLGVAVVGRPSAMGGGPMLEEMAQQIKRPWLVVAEDDRKADGRWPGKEGAIQAAKRLSKVTKKRVPWCLPPEKKDLRRWLQVVAPDVWSLREPFKEAVIKQLRSDFFNLIKREWK
jgi:hypothetical protein